MKCLLIILFLFFSICSIGQNSIVINEFVSNNTNGVKDKVGDCHDWIELYNPGKKRVNLAGCGLSNDPKDPFKYTFPKTIIKSKGYLLLLASKKDTNVKGEIHLPFKIHKNGEPLILSAPNGTIIDEMPQIALVKNGSYGRSLDGSASFERFFKPSPGSSNNKISGIVFSKEQGFYTKAFDLNLISKSGHEIRYTLDGSTPNINSPIYEQSIRIQEIESDSDGIAYIKTSPLGMAITGNYFEGTVIRAATFHKGEIQSQVYTRSYFISDLGRERYANIDVVSLVTDNGNLFDSDTGIYVEGDSVKYASKTANFYKRGKAWERNAHVTFFDMENQVGFEQNVGIRMHGGKGRKNPQKSIRLCASKKYGAPAINYPLFEMREHTVFKTVVLRNSQSCWERSIVKDECTAEICKNLNVDVLAARPVIVFINGEFWGIHAIREYFDADYIASNHKAKEEDVNIILNGYGNRQKKDKNWGLLEGNGASHKYMYRYIKTHSLAIDDNYEFVQKYLNLESIIDYYCIEIFFNNRDWPTNNNKLWSVGRGPWSQVMFDMDAGWSRSFEDNLLRLLSDKKKNRPQNRPYARLLFKKLAESPIFVEALSNRMAYLIKNDFSPKNVKPILEKAKQTYTNYVEENDRRWGLPTGYRKWKHLFLALNGFAEGRPRHLEKIFVEHFNLSLDSLQTLN